jgi:diguanylate cyclase (GGDEF)-like protein/PAS domain S-box-containing protein
VEKEQTLHLIVIDDSSNDAETVSNSLRNAGHAVRAARVEDGEDLRETLKDQTWDMILCKLEIPFFSAVEAVGIVQNMDLDMPVLALCDECPTEKVTETLRGGVRDLVSLRDPLRLEHVVMREFGDVIQRRELRVVKRQLEESNRRAQGLVETSRDAIAYVHEGMHVFSNESYLQLFGYSDPAELEGMPLLSMVAPADQGKFKEVLRRLGKATSIEVALLKSTGDEFQVKMEFSPTTYEGEHCTQVVIRDQSTSKELEEKLESLSRQDLLTGLFNRRYFLDKLQQTVGGGTHQGALLFLEPDRFREIREDVGIAPSDMLIAELAGVLQKALSSTSILLARFDGPTFALLATGEESEKAEAVAKALLKRIAEHVCEVGGSTLTVTCSAGIAFFNESLTNPQEILSRAEKARRQAADGGGNIARVYNPAAEEMAEKERAAVWARKLKLALRDNAFHLVYQPIVSLHGDPNENYEVYLRMVDEGQEINPIDFISAAEQAGLMVAIDRWVLHNTVRTLIERRRAGKNTNLFVNISDASVKDPQLLAWLRELLKAARLDGSFLILELSEAVAQANLRTLKALADGLSQLHVRLAIDHFGVAANSGHLLRHVQPTYLKLHGSLMKEFARNQDSQRQVKELSALAKEAKCLTVAEFVEDANTLAALWTCGVDYIQGFFLQRPVRDLSYDFGGGGEG